MKKVEEQSQARTNWHSFIRIEPLNYTSNILYNTTEVYYAMNYTTEFFQLFSELIRQIETNKIILSAF